MKNDIDRVWESPALKWIHEAREAHYREEQEKFGGPRKELSPEAQELVNRLGLTLVSAGERPHCRQTSRLS